MNLQLSDKVNLLRLVQKRLWTLKQAKAYDKKQLRKRNES